MTVIDYATGEVTHLTEAEARRLTERIRTALDRVSTAWADLAERITEAYQRRADLALGYATWAEYADAELRPAEGLAVEVRRQLVSMLSAAGMSTRAIAPTVGISDRHVRRDVAQVGHRVPPAPDHIDLDTGEVVDAERYPQARRAPWPERRDDPEPERIDRITGEAVPAPTFKPLDVTDWTPEELDAQIAADDAVIESYERATVPAPVKVVGLDGKTYTRPEPKETPKEATMTAASRLAIPQPPKHGGNRPKHNQVIGNVIVSAQGLCIVADEIKTLDGSINSEEAASYADDLSRIIRSLKRIQQLLTKEV